MSRVIKFRAWDKDTSAIINLNNSGVGVALDSDSLVVLQYTGRKDSRDVEVYEGDIVFFTHDNKPVGYKGRFKVIYRDCNFVITDKDERHNFWLGSKRVENLEVLGNIYETPELLEAG